MLKIAHYVDVFLPITENWIYSQIASAKRYESFVISRTVVNEEAFTVAKLFALQRDLKRYTLIYNKIVKQVSRFYPYFITKLRNEYASLIHAHMGMAGYWILGEKEKLGLPLVTSFYGMDASSLPRNPVWKKRYSKLFAKGDLFLVEGAAMKKRLVAIGCPAEKIKVHHLGIDVAAHRFSSNVQKNGKPFKILQAARFVEKKGIPYALKAFALAKKEYPDLEFVLIGDGPEKETVLRCIDELGIASSVRLLGYLSHGEFLKELESCHLYLQPSVTSADGDTEGGAPVTLLSAQAVGRPVVATFHADIPETVVDGKTGFLSIEKDVNALAKNILKLVKEPAVAAAMGEAGREHIELNYNEEKQADE